MLQATDLPGGACEGTPRNLREWTIRARCADLEAELAAIGRASIRATGERDPNLVLFANRGLDGQASRVRALVGEWLDLYAEYHGTERRTA